MPEVHYYFLYFYEKTFFSSPIMTYFCQSGGCHAQRRSGTLLAVLGGRGAWGPSSGLQPVQLSLLPLLFQAILSQFPGGCTWLCAHLMWLRERWMVPGLALGFVGRLSPVLAVWPIVSSTPGLSNASPGVEPHGGPGATPMAQKEPNPHGPKGSCESRGIVRSCESRNTVDYRNASKPPGGTVSPVRQTVATRPADT